VFCNIARRLKFVDEPDGKIKKHKQATPYLGGVAIYVGFLAALCLTFPFENNMLLFFVGSTLLLFIGLIDDLVVLKPIQKFGGQLLATFCFLKAGLYLKEQFFYNVWNIPISVLWILLVINSFNLVDVMDGLASILAICATSTFLALAFYFQNYVLAILLCAFLGPLIAFFWYNRPTAKIYLGDAGSLFIGGFLAAIPFLFNWGTHNMYGFLTPIVILAVPLLEVSTLILVRSYKKIPFYIGSPDHFSIYLQQNGWSKQAILKYIISISIFLGIVSILFASNQLKFITLALFAGLFLLFWYSALFYKKSQLVKQL
jgi:UDP-GlcNAc:undecaprenyl-phosphate GlcNAc-1-phosphate transferase